jgi:hypothetical protein
MNEVFGMLKGIIRGCEGVEMHKLDILQTCIEYVSYLKGCVGQVEGAYEKRRGQDGGGRPKVKGREEEEIVGLTEENSEGDESDLNSAEDEDMADVQSHAEPSSKRHRLGHLQ